MVRMHPNITIRYMEDMAEEKGSGVARYFSHRGITEEEALAYLAELKAKGYDCVPVCDNTNEQGRCAGHPVAGA